MTENTWKVRVANPPKDKPILLYDGECKFCIRWALRLKQWTKNSVDYSPYQKEHARFPEIPKEDLRHYVQLVEINGLVCYGAAAAFRCLHYAKCMGWLFWLYCRIPLFARLSENIYQFVSKNRNRLY